MDPGVMAMMQKSISAKLCPTVIGQTCMDVVVNPPKPGDPSHDSWSGEVAATLASYADRAKLVADTLNSIQVGHGMVSNCVSLYPSCRASPATTCRGPCTPSPASPCLRRPWKLPRKLDSQQMSSTPLTFLRPLVSVLFLALALGSSLAPSTSGRDRQACTVATFHYSGPPSCHRRT